MAQAIKLAGGKENISFHNFNHNRLALTLKDQSLVDLRSLQKMRKIKAYSLKNGRLLLTLAISEEDKIMASANKYDGFAQTIIEKVGGRENIQTVTHCITRLRFKLKDESKADTESLTHLDGVIKIMQAGGQYQVVVGSKVEDVYDAVCRIAQIKNVGVVEKEEDKPAKKEGIFAKLMDLISGTMAPMLMALAAAGVIKGLISLFSSLGWLSTTSGTYQVLYAIGDGFFYFLPIILGYTAAKKFGCNEFTGMAIGAALVYPQMVAITKGKVLGTIFAGSAFQMSYYCKFLGIPVVMPPAGYTSSVIPILLAVWLATKLEKWLRGVIPQVVRGFLTPVITFAVMAPLTYLVIGPVAAMLSSLLSLIITMLYTIPAIGGTLGGALIGGTGSILVMFGLHWGLMAIAVNDFTTVGYDYIMGAFSMGQFVGMAQGLAVCIRTHDKHLRDIAIPATVSQLFGVGEPLLYGVMLQRKKLFIMSIVFNTIGGAIVGALGIKCYIMGGMGLFSFPNYINPKSADLNNMLGYMAGVGITCVIAFVGTLIAFKNGKESEKAQG